MTAVRILILLCALVEAGWMTFDGSRALIVGDYVTPESGPRKGELGPWSHAVTAAGLDPRGTPVKMFFVAYGLLWLAVAAAFTFRVSWSFTAMLAAAIGALWYLPVGAVLSAAQIALLVLFRSRLRLVPRQAAPA
jgi:hypothetical protein